MRFRSALPLLAAALTVPVVLAQTPVQAPPPPSGSPDGMMVRTAPPADPPASAPVQVPSYDVISVKPDKSGGMGMRMQMTPDGFHANNVNVHMLLTEGYGLNEDQIVGEPAWTRNDAFDIDAKVAGPDVPAMAKLTFEQRRTMFQQVLTDRFKLTVHHETRQLPVYVLTVAKGGPKLKAVKPFDPASTDDKADGPLTAGKPGPVDKANGPVFAGRAGPGDKADGPVIAGRPGGPGPRRGAGVMMGRGKLQATDIAMPFLVSVLSRQVGRTIIDKTGLTGTYDMTLNWTPEGGGGEGPPMKPGNDAGAPTDPGPDIFTAVQEQLGLKLEATKGPADVLVIDHLEKPAEN
jgi:uncharacterized protein (TIGR03435 family)